MTWVNDFSQIWVFNGRISQPADKSLYLGRADNAGWIYCQDIASEAGSSIWAIHRNSGNAEFSGTVTTGNLLSKGGVTAYSSSDIRLKTNLHKADSLSLIKSLGKVYEFDYKKSGEHSIGLIAQNVQKSKLSDLVANDDEGFLKLNYWSPKLISLALGGVVQVDGKVTRLKKKMKALEKEVKLLKEELSNKNINVLN